MSWADCREKPSTDVGVESQHGNLTVSHRFYYRLRVNDREYPVGEGKTAQDAKQNAAQLAWPVLQVWPLTCFILYLAGEVH